MGGIRTFARSVVACFVMMVLLIFGAGPFLQSVSAAYLGPHYVELSNNTAGAQNVPYTVSFQISTPGTLGSVEIQFCDNSPLIEDPCNAPSGFSAAAAAITSQAGITNFSISLASTANNIILTRPPGAVGSVTATVAFSGITNPANVGSCFARIITHSSSDASGSFTDAGGIAFSIEPSLTVSSEVPPYLIFCAGVQISGFDCNNIEESSASFGDFSPTATSVTQTQFMAATNAGNGYSISLTGTTLTSGNNTIDAMTNGGTAQIGKNQFGMNLVANTNPHGGSNPTGTGTGQPVAAYATPNHFRYNDGDLIATAHEAQEYRKYTATYIVDIGKTQAPGVYSTTITYVCLANF